MRHVSITTDFLYIETTLPAFLKKFFWNQSLSHFKSGKFLRYSGGTEKGSTNTFKSVGSWAIGLQIASPVLCGSSGLTLGSNLHRERWRGCWRLPCHMQFHLPSPPYSLLLSLSLSSLSFLPSDLAGE